MSGGMLMLIVLHTSASVMTTAPAANPHRSGPCNGRIRSKHSHALTDTTAAKRFQQTRCEAILILDRYKKAAQTPKRNSKMKGLVATFKNDGVKPESS